MAYLNCHMIPTDIEQIKKLVADLDAAVPRDGAQVCLLQYGGGPDESKVLANQRGYLRLGIEFLQAAFAPASSKSPQTIQADLRYLLTDNSTIGFDWFERREDISIGRNADRKVNRFVPVISVAVLSLGLFFAIIGLVTVIGWMIK